MIDLLTTAQRRPFLSENYIFGKFDAFCKRLEKIDYMLNTMENLAGVNNVKIEVGFFDILIIIIIITTTTTTTITLFKC